MLHSSTDIEGRKSKFDLKTLLDTGRLLIESHDSEFIINNLLLISLGKLLITKGMVLLQADRKQKKYIIADLKGRLPLVKGDTITLRGRLLADDTTIIHSGDDHYPDELAGSGLTTMVSLKTSGHAIGWLALGPKFNGTPLSTSESEFLESLTIMSSVALSNSKLIDELQSTNRQLDRKVQELYTLFDLSKEFNATVDRDQIIRIFKFALMGQMVVRNFFFALERDGLYEVLTQNGIHRKISVDELLSLYKISDEITTVSEDLIEKAPILRDIPIALLVPLMTQNRKTALIGLGARSNHEPYTQSDHNFLISLGNLAVTSIQKTYLLEERIEKERIEKELRIARTIQQGLLPDSMPVLKGFDIDARNISSQQVGGDYYDIIPYGSDEFFLAIGDVTGKGIPASLIMANIQSILHTLVPIDLTLEEKTERINDIIHKNTPPDQFVTFIWGVLNTSERTFSYVNAGHNPPLLFPAHRKKTEFLREGGLILGAMPSLTPYKRQTVKLEKGDVLVFYTDGVTEAMDNDGKEFDEDGLIKCVSSIRNESAGKILTHIVECVDKFSAGHIGDDLTLMVLKAC